jgi:phage tail-like protein
MAQLRERPYLQFNFHANFSTDNQHPDAAFQEISGLQRDPLDASTTDQSNNPRKITGTYKVGDVTLKRGVIGELSVLGEWLQQVRDGHPSAGRVVSITLYDESRQPVQLWRLQGARPVKYTGPTLSGKGTDVAIEELVLSCERIELK